MEEKPSTPAAALVAQRPRGEVRCDVCRQTFIGLLNVGEGRPRSCSPKCKRLAFVARRKAAGLPIGRLMPDDGTPKPRRGRPPKPRESPAPPAPGGE